ncbi:MAG: hypothetical protein IJ702_08650 [Fretibacterium sp.]|nr:hypothetical protein [Fretibacterium sp.]
MTEQDFLVKMKEILDNEDVTMDTALADIEEWDSVSVVGYVAMANATCGKRPIAEQIRGCASIRDLYGLLGA